VWVVCTSFGINTEVVVVPFHDVIAGVGCSVSAMRYTSPVFYADIINHEREL
jgi:hypothetical protein